MDRNWHWQKVEEVTQCTTCNKDLDFRDYGRYKLCFACRAVEKAKEQENFLQKLKLLSVEDRIARLEEFFMNHEDRHPSKELW